MHKISASWSSESPEAPYVLPSFVIAHVRGFQWPGPALAAPSLQHFLQTQGTALQGGGEKGHGNRSRTERRVLQKRLLEINNFCLLPIVTNS